MIVRLGGRAPAEVARRLHRVANRLVTTEANAGRDAVGRIHAAAARPRLRDLAKATDALVPQIVAAITALHRPVVDAAARWLTESSIPNRDIAEADKPITTAELQQLLAATETMSGSDLEAALSKAMKALYKKGIAHAKVELRAGETWDGQSTRALAALDRYALDFATDVAADEKIAIKALLRDALREGVSIKALTASIADYMAGGVHRIDRNGDLIELDVQTWARQVARTEVARSQNAGTMAAYAKLGVAYVRWIAADDERTCPICGGLDGVETEAGSNFPDTDVAAPPAHVACRCTVVAVRNADGTVVRATSQQGEADA